MRTRDAVLDYQDQRQNSLGTYERNLDLVDPISALAIEIEATNGATSNLNNFLSDAITKVEITDGSEVLYSVSGIELQALEFYKTGKTPALFPSEWAGGTQRELMHILFGRRLWDTEFAMNFTRFRNPQLKIAYNMAAIRAVGATGFAAAPNLKLTVVAKVMEGSPHAAAYLMAKQIASFDSSATSGAQERKELPTDRVYRMLMTRHWTQLKDIDEITSDLKLTSDTDKFVAFTRKVKQLDTEAFARWGAGRIKHDMRIADNTQTRLLFNKEPDVRAFITTQNLFDIWGIAYQWSSEIKSWLGTHAGAADATVREMTAVEEGHALHATLPIPFGDPERRDTWFDPTIYKKLEMVFTSGGNAGTCSIVAEQVRPL